tara:strand:+ start:370 stop:552 length:183 start_codon:yes stop_codon:yes gene_type:complete
MSLFLFFFVKKVRKTGVQKDSRRQRSLSFQVLEEEEEKSSSFLHSFILLREQIITQTHNK